MIRLKTILFGLLLADCIFASGHLQAQEKAPEGGEEVMTKDKATAGEAIFNNPAMIKSDAMNGKYNNTEPLVCQLTGPEQAERKKALQKEVFSQVKKTEETQEGYIFYFPYEEDLLIKLTDFVIVENNCCAFFTFDIRLQAKNDVRLTISGSSEKAKEMIAMALIQKK